MHIINPMRHAVSIALLVSFLAGSLQAAIFTVTTTADNGNNATPTAGSLRAAIKSSNAAGPGPNTINFNIGGSGPFTIQPPVDLPEISIPVTINGYSQSGASVNSLAQGNNAKLKIIINGNNYSVGDGFVTGNGLHFVAGSSNSVVMGLVINQWLANGILIDGTAGSVNGVSIIGNFIGTDSTGMIEMSNRSGIGILGKTNPCAGTIIGTTASANRNIINGSFSNYGPDVTTNTLFCGAISSFSIPPASNSGTTIVNNYIGTDVSGSLALGNSLFGIVLLGDSDSFIGGSTATSRNIISGQTVFGIELGSCSGVIVQGNYIGTDITGTKPIANLNSGIQFNNGLAITPTGNSVISNLISGNGCGITIGDTGAPGAILNTIQGNKIGTDISGRFALANSYFGIACQEAQNTISGNVISGNGAGGVMFNGTLYALNNIVETNLIGTDFTGTHPIRNGGNGVQIGLNGGFGGSLSNTIGS